MSETKHSPEPWRYGPADDGKDRQPEPLTPAKHRGHVWAVDATGWSELATIYGRDYDPAGDAEGGANARRIVACVNACAGLPTAALEAGALHDVLRFAARSVESRDEYPIRLSDDEWYDHVARVGAGLAAALQHLGRIL